MFISDDVLKKLKERHHVESHEVSECLNNREGKLLKDTRQQHCTVPETYWFIAQTKKARWLKVVLICSLSSLEKCCLGAGTSVASMIWPPRAT